MITVRFYRFTIPESEFRNNTSLKIVKYHESFVYSTEMGVIKGLMEVVHDVEGWLNHHYGKIVLLDGDTLCGELNNEKEMIEKLKEENIELVHE